MSSKNSYQQNIQKNIYENNSFINGKDTSFRLSHMRNDKQEHDYSISPPSSRRVTERKDNTSADILQSSDAIAKSMQSINDRIKSRYTFDK
jgi:hypothetical protein